MKSPQTRNRKATYWVERSTKIELAWPWTRARERWDGRGNRESMEVEQIATELGPTTAHWWEIESAIE
jgi:hypothetical protein